MAFIPFDATEEEIAQKSIVRDGIPDVLAEPLKAWLAYTFQTHVDYVDQEAGLKLQLELDMNLGFTAISGVDSRTFAERAFLTGQTGFMRILDYALYSLGWGSHDSVKELAEFLDIYRSKYAVVRADGRSRIGYRVPNGVEETMQEAINAADATAGRLLAEAWGYAFGLDAKPEEAMDKAVKAVERAATPVVCPNHPFPSLGNAVSVVKQQGDWVHGLRFKADAFPVVTLHHMMQTLWYGQQYRHVDKNAVPPTVEQARTHVMLAATLVGWFASGQIMQDSSEAQPKNWTNLEP